MAEAFQNQVRNGSDFAAVMSGRRLWMLRLLTIAISFVVSLALIEVGVRVYQRHSIVQPVASVGDMSGVYEFSPARHHRLVPNGRYRHHEVEFDYLWINNSLGMRDRERSARKPAGTFRILFLGDSMVQGYGVPQKETMVALLEESLKEPKREKRIEVLNGGVFGYSPFLEYLYLQEIMSVVEPDMVVVGFFLGNDVGDDYFYTRQARLNDDGEVSFADASWPWGYRDELLKSEANNVKVETKNYPQTWVLKSQLIRLLLRLYERRRAYEQYRDSRQREARLMLERKEDIRVNLAAVNYPATDKLRRMGYWEISKSYLQDMHRLCQRQHVPMILAVIPFVEPGTGEFNEFEEPHEILKEFAKKLSIPVVFLITEFHKWPAKELLFALDGHWNAFGNRVAAGLMDQELRRLNFLPPVVQN